MIKENDIRAINDILSRDNTAEVKRNKEGDIIILEVKKRIANN